MQNLVFMCKILNLKISKKIIKLIFILLNCFLQVSCFGSMWGKTESLDQSESSTSHSNATHLQGVEISSETPFENGQFLKYNGSIWIPSIITLSNIRSSVTNNSALSTTCNSNQTLNYNSISDSFECSTISINASQITQGVLPITFGGTGASTASEAVNNLLTDVQSISTFHKSTLTAIVKQSKHSMQF